MRKCLALVILVFSFVLVYSQEFEPQRYSEYFSFGIESKKSKNILDKHYNDYLEKCKVLGIDKFECEYTAYPNKININKINEFKSIGIDIIEILNLNSLDESRSNKLDEIFLFYPVIIVGTVVSIEECVDYSYKTAITIKVDSYLKGDYYFESLPKTYKLYSYAKFIKKDNIKIIEPSYTEYMFNGQNFRGVLHIGNRIIFLMKKLNYESFSDERKEHYPQDCKLANVSIVEDSKYFIIGSNKHLIENIICSDLESYFEGVSDTTYSNENVEYYEKIIQQQEEINETKNFYNIEFK